MARIDAHQHFWFFDDRQEEWITEEMAAIKRDFFPPDLEPVLRENGMDGCVLVQVNQEEAENDFFIGLARQHPFIKAVVGWVDLCAQDIAGRLVRYQNIPQVRGFRHLLQGEKDRAYMLGREFQRGIAALGDSGFTFDLLVLPDQLGYATRLAKMFPQVRFVLDHLGKPRIARKEMQPWQSAVEALATCPNVYAKLSGMVTEASWNDWREEDLRPYLDVMTQAFGTGRLMFGSDWPVCLVAASYARVVEAVSHYFIAFSPLEQEAVFGDNAVRFYGLSQ